MKILLRFFFLLSALLTNNLGWSAQIAYVKSRIAYIYSDQDLQSPIGFVRQGKKLTVGDVSRKRGSLLPIIVSGRIAYIKRDDLSVQDALVNTLIGKGYTEHELVIKEEKEDKLNENNYFVFTYNTFNPGPQWEEMTETLNNDSTQAITSFNFLVEHHPEIYNYFFGVGGGYYTLSLDDFSFSSITAEFTIGYNLYKPMTQAYIDLYGGFSFSRVAKVKVKDAQKDHTGNMYGYNIGIQTRIFPEEEYGLILGFSYKIVNLTNMPDIELPSYPTDYNLKSLNGFNLFLGFHNKF